VTGWRLVLATAVAFASMGSAFPLADDAGMPDFLKHTYAANAAACDSTGHEKAGLAIKDGLISGTEFGCAFLTYTPVVWDPDYPPSEYVVLASCGDDSGITRPDLISIIHSGDTLRVQSQNEYVEMVAKGAWNEPGFISRTYEKCPAG